MNERQIGRFYADAHFLRSPEAVHLFAGMVPLHIESAFYKDRLLYVCQSERFREVPVGGRVPLYTVDITQEENSDTPTFTFTEVDDAEQWSLP